MKVKGENIKRIKIKTCKIKKKITWTFAEFPGEKYKIEIKIYKIISFFFLAGVKFFLNITIIFIISDWWKLFQNF